MLLTFKNTVLLLAGFGIIYFICEIVLYFIHLFLPGSKSLSKDENMSDTLKISIGGGDITVFALISVFLGFKLAFMVLFIASLLGILSHFIIGAVNISQAKSEKYIPFVSYLSLACFIIIITSHGS